MNGYLMLVALVTSQMEVPEKPKDKFIAFIPEKKQKRERKWKK